MSFGAEFLVYPDLFPARPGGEPWGEYEVELELIGGPYRFTGLNREQRRRVEECYGKVIRQRTAAPPEVTIRLFRASQKDFLPLRQFPWHYRIDLDPTPRSVRFATFEFMGRLDWSPQLECAVWTPEGGERSFDGVFANTFRMVAAYRLLELGGALIHSAGLVDRGRALLFVGPSGAGKSTVARLGSEAGLTVLSDDLNALCVEAGQARVEKVPFAGDLRQEGRFGSFPLGRLLRLVKGAQASLQPLSAAKGLALLLACAPFVNTDPWRREQLMGNLQRLVGLVTAGELTFTRDGRFLDLVRSEQAA